VNGDERYALTTSIDPRALPISPAVERDDPQAPYAPIGRGRPTGPRGLEVVGQEAREVLALDAEHHVVPGEVVLAEVDPTEVRHPSVEDRDLLVVPTHDVRWPRTERIAELDADASRAQAAHPAVREHDLATEPTIEPGRPGNHPIAVVEQAVAVDQQASVRRGGSLQGPAERGPDAVGLEREGLDEGGLARGGQIVSQAPPELRCADQELEFHRQPAIGDAAENSDANLSSALPPT
jgi:hypothetical protein